MGSLERLGLAEPIRAHIAAGRPYLGICLGYQLLFTESEEFGHAKGLDVLPGVVRRFPPGLKVPHMGWNRLWHDGTLPLLAGIPAGAYFYFVHSYYPEVSAALRAEGVRAAHCEYGRPLPGAGRARPAVRHPVPPGEEPGLGAPAPRELRPARGRRGGGARVIVIPAIDLQGGRCVRLVEGRADSATVFGDDPVAMARRWAERGARRLHVVDLDGAFDGAPRARRPDPRDGGGGPGRPRRGGRRPARPRRPSRPRSATGARWAVLGTAAALEPAVLEAACARWPGRILVGVDAVDGRVAVRGWTDVLPLTAHELVEPRGGRRAPRGAIYTDVRRDGTGRGPNLEATAALAARRRGARHRVGGHRRGRRPRPPRGHPERGRGHRRPGPLHGRRRPRRGDRRGGGLTAMLARRVIPCLDVKDGRVVKGVRFLDLADAGDPVEAAIAYDRQGADELVFLDITASHEGRATMLDVVRRTAEAVYLPLTVGGGLGSLEDVRTLLRAGADKVSLNTAAVARPELIRDAAVRFGSQCIVVAIDAKRRAAGGRTRRSRSTRTAAGGPRAGTRSPGPARPWTWGRARSCSPAWTGTGRGTGTTSS